MIKWRYQIVIMVFCVLILGWNGFASAQSNLPPVIPAKTLLVGAADLTGFDFLTPISLDTFRDVFVYQDSSQPSLTMDSDRQAVIGVIWAAPGDAREYEVRITIDTNRDGEFNPLDWNDPHAPWNRPDNNTPGDPDDDPLSWEYIYPADYPDATLRGASLRLNWDEDCECVIDFPWATFDWVWYEGKFDHSQSGYAVANRALTFIWSGRDSAWNLLPNGRYPVEVILDENQDGLFSAQDPKQKLVIEIRSASISGQVLDISGKPIKEAKVEISSFFAWGVEFTDSNGNFTITGLKSDQSYGLTISAPRKVLLEISGVRIPADQYEVRIPPIVLEDAVTLAGTIKLDQNANGVTDEAEDRFQPFTNRWGFSTDLVEVQISAWNTDGPGSGAAIVEIFPGKSGADFMLYLPTGPATVYEVSFSAEGFASKPVTVRVDQGGGDAGVIVLTRASLLKGMVKLPQTVTDWIGMEIMARNMTNQKERYIGWGVIDPYFVAGFCSAPSYGDQETCEAAEQIWIDERWSAVPLPVDSGGFQFDGLPAGLYQIVIRALGYKPTVLENIEIRRGEDQDLGLIPLELGSVISGVLTIQGDAVQVVADEAEDQENAMTVWVYAWSPITGEFSGADVNLPHGINQTAPYQITGLSDGRYMIEATLADGYELAASDGTAPIMIDLNDSLSLNLILRPYQGVITGVLTMNGAAPDLSKVLVQAIKPHETTIAGSAAVSNGGIDPLTGVYTIRGLGTDDYLVKAGLYTNPDQFAASAPLIIDPSAGIVLERVLVENNASRPTRLDIDFKRGRSVAGTIRLSSTDPPWHDFGNGAGGGADGKQNATSDHYNEVISIAADLAGFTISAEPMALALMSSQGLRPITGVISDNGDGTAAYRIDGLSPGAYIIVPPLTSPRISALEPTTDDSGFPLLDVSRRHWTVPFKVIVIAEQTLTQHDIMLENGFAVSGSLTLPEAQTASDLAQGWEWVGFMELVTADDISLGHFKTLFKKDFKNKATYNFTFPHVASGDYLLYFWTDRYVAASVKVTVANADTIVNLQVEKGVNLVGTLLDAGTGRPVTSADGVRVLCEAVPFVEGSHRETRDDVWSNCYIENTSGLIGPRNGLIPGKQRHSRPGTFHLTALPAGHQYVIVIEADHGPKSRGAKNYTRRVIAGIEIPSGASGDIHVGRIELKEGVVITGRVVDVNGDPIPGVDILAVPTDRHDGHWAAEAVSDTQGYYTLYGIDPEVVYYDLIAAKRPWIYEKWGKQVEWGEERVYNARWDQTDPMTGRTLNADFVLARATASLTGTITIPPGASFQLPFKSDTGREFPAAFILLRKKGVAYRDMLEGVEGLTAPQPDTARTAEYRIDHIAPGAYQVIFMNYGLPRAEIDNIEFAAHERKVLNVSWDDDFYRLSGSLSLAGGGYPSGADVSGVVCLNTRNRTVIFGRLVKEADGSLSAYEVPGLVGSDTYQLIFYSDVGIDDTPEVFSVGDSFVMGYADRIQPAVIDRDRAPVIILRAFQDPADSALIQIGLFSTAYLVDNQIEISLTEPTAASAGQVYLKTGKGVLEQVSFGDNKRRILLQYRQAGDDDLIELVVCVHYGAAGAAKLAEFSLSAGALIINSDRVSQFVGEQVALGNGDSSRLYIPAGAIESPAGDNLTVTLQKTRKQGSGLTTAVPARLRSGRKVALLPELPNGVQLVSHIYTIAVKDFQEGGNLIYHRPLTVQLEYDPALVADAAQLNVYRNQGGAWVKQANGRVVDVRNAAISVEVEQLSDFVVGYGVESQPPAQRSTLQDIGAGDSGECFISASGYARRPGWLPALMLGLAIIAGLGWKRMERKKYEGRGKSAGNFRLAAFR